MIHVKYFTREGYSLIYLPKTKLPGGEVEISAVVVGNGINGRETVRTEKVTVICDSVSCDYISSYQTERSKNDFKCLSDEPHIKVVS